MHSARRAGGRARARRRRRRGEEHSDKCLDCQSIARAGAPARRRRSCPLQSRHLKVFVISVPPPSRRRRGFPLRARENMHAAAIAERRRKPQKGGASGRELKFWLHAAGAVYCARGRSTTFVVFESAAPPHGLDCARAAGLCARRGAHAREKQKRGSSRAPSARRRRVDACASPCVAAALRGQRAAGRLRGCIRRVQERVWDEGEVERCGDQ